MKKSGNSAELVDKNASEQMGTHTRGIYINWFPAKGFKIPGSYFSLNINKE
ncbi:MAG: hypothetical protein MUF15_09985 [Acidobacteria bacterium]|jgi:hypothetical protein|nr:hypothetical protein [Acidobacteriota bacterium]